VLAVLEAAAGEEDGEIDVVVRVRIAHVAAVEDQLLTELAGGLAMAAQVFIAVGRVLIGVESEDRCGERVHHQRHDAGGVRFEGQSGHGEHEIELLEEQLLVLHIGGPRGGRGGRGALLPFAGDVGALFESAGNPLP
jgi:hypothetical protein